MSSNKILIESLQAMLLQMRGAVAIAFAGKSCRMKKRLLHEIEEIELKLKKSLC